ncbi:MAG: hypothetical protein SNJ57_12085 [Cyanobacteriota bacterium]
MAPPGTITLTNPLTGMFRVAYTRRSGSIPLGSVVDLLPYRRVLEPSERVTRLNTLAIAAKVFSEIASLTGETQWNRAADAAIATVKTLDLSQPVYLWRKQPGGSVLSAVGVRIVSSVEDRFLTVMRLPNGAVNLYLPPLHNGAVEFQQTDITPAIAPSSEILVEMATSVSAIAKLVIQTEAVRWEAAIATFPTLTIQAIAGQDFVQWSSATEWHPTDGTSETFVQGSGSATQQHQNVSIGTLHPVAKIFTLVPNLGAAGAILRGRFGSVPAAIAYAASNPVRLRLQDAAGWFWETTLPMTGGQFQTKTLSWSDFLLSGVQQNGSTLPIAPNQQGAIQRYEFVVTQAAATLAIQYIGAPPQRLSSPVVPTLLAIKAQETSAHVLTVGDVVLTATPAPPYRIVQRDLQLLPSNRIFRGNSLTWQQPTGDSTVHQFWVDAQDQYWQDTGIMGPFCLAYRWGTEGSPGFVDQDDVYNLAWGGWQAKTGAIACREWYVTGSAVARLAAERWIDFLDQQWGEGEAIALDPFDPLPQAQLNLLNSPIAAWYMEAALYSNIAGGDRLTTYRVLSKAVALLLRQVDFAAATPPQQAGEGAIATLHAAACLLRHQREIRYPTPSETGDLNSDFAAKVAKIMAFQPALNLPVRNAYGFRFRVPFSLKNLEPPVRLTTDSTNYTIDTTQFTIDTTHPTL